jgi:hypothetical protein
MVRFAPSKDATVPGTVEGPCLYKVKVQEGTGRRFMQRQCQFCKFRQPGRGKVTNQGVQQEIEWEACRDRAVAWRIPVWLSRDEK